MTQLEEQAQLLIDQTLRLAHATLAKHPSSSSQTRDLSETEHTLIQNLDQKNSLRETLITALAIDSYSTHISRQGSMLEEVSSLFPVVFEKMNKLEDSLSESKSDSEFLIFEEAYQALVRLLELHQAICPKSQYINQQNEVLNRTKTASSKHARSESPIEAKLRSQNEELQRQLQLNDDKLFQMELKLQKILKDHELKQDYPSGSMNQSRYKMMNYLELKEELAYKEAQIERMNQEFSYEIEKYNTVYDAIKRQLEELKAYQNIDLIEQIELLETEIVRLREERERDDIIIKQLRSDTMMYSGSSHLSPRSNTRFQHSRYNY